MRLRPALRCPACRPIPDGPPPEPVVEALEDVAALPAQQLCQLGSGQVVAFSQLRWGQGQGHATGPPAAARRRAPAAGLVIGRIRLHHATVALVLQACTAALPKTVCLSCVAPSPGRSIIPDLGRPTSVLCQQAAAAGLTQEALLRHLVSAALVRSGGAPLPALPEAAAVAEAAAAAAAAAAEAAASEAQPWSLLADLQPLDEEAVTAFAEEEFDWVSWRPVEAEGEAGAAGGEPAAAAGAAAPGPAFEFVDATQDPSLDPVRQQQSAWEEEQAAAAASLPLSYDEIRGGDPYQEVAAAVGYPEPGAADWAQQQEGGEGQQHLEHMHPTKQRVWVLLGGDGPQRTQSLAAGLHAYLRCAAAGSPVPAQPATPPPASLHPSLPLHPLCTPGQCPPGPRCAVCLHGCLPPPSPCHCRLPCSLRNNPELLVEAFMLEASFAGQRCDAGWTGRVVFLVVAGWHCRPADGGRLGRSCAPFHSGRSARCPWHGSCVTAHPCCWHPRPTLPPPPAAAATRRGGGGCSTAG